MKKDIACKYFGTKDGNYKTFLSRQTWDLLALLGQPYSFVSRQDGERIYIGHLTWYRVVLCAMLR
jgi:hypothetical protein